MPRSREEAKRSHPSAMPPGEGVCAICGRRTLYGDHVGMLIGDKCEPNPVWDVIVRKMLREATVEDELEVWL